MSFLVSCSKRKALKSDYDENFLLSFRIFSRSIKSMCSESSNGGQGKPKNYVKIIMLSVGILR